MLRRAFRILGDVASVRAAPVAPRLAYHFTTSSAHRALDESSAAGPSSAASSSSTSAAAAAAATTPPPPPSPSHNSASSPSSTASSILPGSQPSPVRSLGAGVGTGTSTGVGASTGQLRSAKNYRLHVQATSNNTMLTLTDPDGNPVHSTSGGTAGFKKSARSGYEAGYQAALSMFSAISSRKSVWARSQGRAFSRLEVIWKGFGAGRDAVYRALLAAEGEETRNMVRSMSDATKLKVGGVRPRKRRNY
ncbi:translational machinery component [Microstroma glucosiphilum]|uniref:Translational machinery component n=1 Tax=Pseudomicrostroma glucosiphilum TaxID=1684307 RepID=A0A316UJL5_9BASI|nr:translational machinery component [Pseudomicrostroma glucosiphilum]PWN24153.1 translational machinery component [Pseudomicrostroma glucosiphilum]